jgi:carbon storage regulator CsrA
VLILNRRMGEAVVMDGGIRVVILSCDRRGVRLGIEAPAETVVLREELSAIRYPLCPRPYQDSRGHRATAQRADSG